MACHLHSSDPYDEQTSNTAGDCLTQSYYLVYPSSPFAASSVCVLLLRTNEQYLAEMKAVDIPKIIMR